MLKCARLSGHWPTPAKASGPKGKASSFNHGSTREPGALLWKEICEPCSVLRTCNTNILLKPAEMRYFGISDVLARPPGPAIHSPQSPPRYHRPQGCIGRVERGLKVVEARHSVEGSRAFNGLLWGIVSVHFGLVGFPGTIDPLQEVQWLAVPPNGTAAARIARDGRALFKNCAMSNLQVSYKPLEPRQGAPRQLNKAFNILYYYILHYPILYPMISYSSQLGTIRGYWSLLGLIGLPWLALPRL